MCLRADDVETKEFWNTEKRKGKKWCWCIKIYKFENGKLYSPFFDSDPIEFGEIVSNRDSKYYNDHLLTKGIHVCYFLAEIQSWLQDLKDFNEHPVCCRVKCYKEDFVAADQDGNAVFMKVRLSRAEYRKAIRESRKLYPLAL